MTLIPSADGSPAGFSVFGLDAAANSFMLNGLAMNGSTLPRDAAISTTVATSPYDVSRGGFSGGQVSTRSQSGGNYIVRTMSFTGITPQMQWSDRAAQSLALESTNASVSGRVSGPIKLNRAFYNVSFQYDDNHRDLRTLLDIDAIGLQAVGISQDSVTRLREALLETGLPYSVSGFPSANKTQRGSLLGSFDFTPNSSQGHSLNLTVNGNWGRTLPTGFNSWDSPAHAGRSDNWAGSAQLRHTAYFKSVILSTTSFGFSQNVSESSPYLALPSASVRITSDFVDGSSNVRSILVGGNTSLGIDVDDDESAAAKRAVVAQHGRTAQAHADHGAGSQPVDDRPVVEPVRLVLVQLARRLRGGTSVVVLAHAHAAPAGTQSGHAWRLHRRRVAAEPRPQSHLRRAH